MPHSPPAGRSGERAFSGQHMPELKSGEQLYYAQLIDRPPAYPTARILVGWYSKPAKKPGIHRLLFKHAKLGLDVQEKWLTRDPEKAAILLQTRVAEAADWHRFHATLLDEALSQFAENPFIAWPDEIKPSPVSPFARTHKFVRPAQPTIVNTLAHFKHPLHP